jgi:hypothetical protein
MTGVGEIRKEVKARLNQALGTVKGSDGKLLKVKLDKTGKDMFGHVFNMTMGLFVKTNARENIDVWTSKKFSQFILICADMIATEARKGQVNGFVSGDTYNKAAVVVMRRIQDGGVKGFKVNKKHGCHVHVDKKTKTIKDIPTKGQLMALKQGRLDGDVCSQFLSTQDFS